MLDRLLAVFMKLAITGSMSLLGTVSVLCGYCGFTYLVRGHFTDAGWLLAAALPTGAIAYVMLRRRGDLEDC